MNEKYLCMELVRADDPDAIVTLLKNAGYWNDKAVWRDLGDKENNYATIGGQQSDPVAALAEKIVNSIDARLMNACIAARICPQGKDAPTSVRRAVAQFVEGSDPEKTANGNIEHWVPTQRREQAEMISIAATGSKSDPCLSISDLGEGQTPAAVPRTFMSLAESNKLRIPFVQGKFNMGGTGALRFCGGKHHLQLIVTKRNPALLSARQENLWSFASQENLWSFTVVRQMEPTTGERSSVYRYLAPVSGHDGEKGLLTFAADSLLIRPKYNDAYALPQEFGSFIKLYHYEYTHRSHVLFARGLLRQMDARLPVPALPYVVHECRNFKSDSGKNFANSATGILVRLSDNKGDNLEPDFPQYDEMAVKGQKFRISLFGFKAKKAETYLTRSQGVLFVVNGQTHGVLPQRFFTRKKVGLDYISDSLMVSLDCSDLGRTSLEGLFMNTRESLAESEFRTAVEQKLEDFLNRHPLLREFNNRRREEKVREKTQDNSNLEDALKEILSSSPSLASIFPSGPRLKTPFKREDAAAPEDFKSLQFPSYFRFKGRAQGEEIKRKAEIERDIRIAFETDVEDNYFGRSKEAGTCVVEQEIEETWQPVTQQSMTLFRGAASLKIALEGDIKVGDEVTIRVIVSDEQMLESLTNTARIEILPCKKPGTAGTKGGPKKPKKPPKNDAGIELPTATWVDKADWGSHNFDEKSVLQVVSADSAVTKVKYDFFLNRDNIHLLSELKVAKGSEDVIYEQYKVGMLLLGMSAIHDSGKDADGDEIRKRTDEVTKAASLVLIPMIKYLGKLEYLKEKEKPSDAT